MSGIRPLEPTDIDAVLDLLRDSLPRFSLTREMLLASTVDDPWRDEEIPSLVSVDEDGSVIGFVSAQVRRMQFEGRPIRGACLSDLAVAPEHRKGAAGALLLGRLLAGPQDVTWSDSTTDVVVRAWHTFGGHLDHARAADFMLVLRPGAFLRKLVSARLRGNEVDRRVMPVGALPVGAAGRWLTGRADDAADPGTAATGAEAGEIVEAMGSIGGRLRLSVNWDADNLRRRLELVERINGSLVTRIVRRGKRAIGWYTYVPRENGVCRLLHLAADERFAAAVFAELIDHSRRSGGVVLTGRAEPHLQKPLRDRFAALGYAWQPVLKARDPEIAAVLTTGRSLLTRLDGELSAFH